MSGDLHERVRAVLADHPDATVAYVQRHVHARRASVATAVRGVRGGQTTELVAGGGERGGELGSRAFGVNGVAATPTGLAIDGELSFEDYERVGAALGAMRDWAAWALGDWIVYGERVFDDGRVAQAVEATGRAKATLVEYARVARRVPPPRRREALSFTHHQLAAAREPAEQDELLDLAELQRLSVEELRGLLREPRLVDKAGVPALPPAGGDESNLAEKLEKTTTALRTTRRLARRVVEAAEPLDDERVVVPRDVFDLLAKAVGR